MPPIPQQTPALKPFIFHGAYVQEKPGLTEAVGDCPFCGREQKFYVNTEKTTWNCFGCARSGNATEFLRVLYEESLARTYEQQYRELAVERRLLSHDTLIKWGLCNSILRDEWMLPGYYYGSDKLKNLYRYTDYGSKDGRKHILATPGTDHCLYGVQMFDKDKDDVYICEGPWDGMTLWETMRTIKATAYGYDITGSESTSLLQNANVIAVPSANTFTEYWARLLTGKRVFLLLDNDHPKIDGNRAVEPAAWLGMKRMVRQIVEWDVRPREIHYLAWGGKDKDHDPNRKHGYDVRDLLTEGYVANSPSGSQSNGKADVTWRLNEIEKRTKQFDLMLSMIRPVPANWIDPTAKGDTPIATNGKKRKKQQVVALEPMPCDNWKTLIDSWKKALVWHRGLEKALSVMLAVVTSTMQKGSQLWVKIVGPPSSGKSVLCDALCVHRDYVTPKSEIRGFYSGFRPPKADGGGEDDLGLIAEIRNKTFVTKDGDTLLQSVNKEQLLAEARDLYDGRAETHFKNGMGKEYNNLRTTWILCGTESLRDLDTSELGERFLDCVVLDKIAPELERQIGVSAVRRMAKTMLTQVSDKPESMDDPDKLLAKKLTAGYVEHLRKNVDILLQKVDENTTDAIYDNLYDLGLFVAFMRSRPSKKQEEKAQRELAARLPEQLTRLALCLAAVMNAKGVTTDVMNRVKEVAFDTARGTAFDITQYLYRNHRGADQDTIQNTLHQKEERMNELLRFMRRIGAFETYRESMGDLSGRTMYRLTKQLRTICDKVFED